MSSMLSWLPLESNPNLMNKYLKTLGVKETFGISDVVSLDESTLDKVPTPTLALIFLFPITPKYSEYWKKVEENVKANQKNLDDVYYMKQTIHNACGTIALIHAMANTKRILGIHRDSIIKKFLDATRDMSPDERGRYLEQASDIIAAHQSCAQEGETSTSEDHCDNHYIVLLNVNDQLVELDGRKFGPIVYGPTSEGTFLRDAFRICREYMEREPDNHNFTALRFEAKATSLKII